MQQHDLMLFMKWFKHDKPICYFSGSVDCSYIYGMVTSLLPPERERVRFIFEEVRFGSMRKTCLIQTHLSFDVDLEIQF